ncbi:MAG: tRNA (guanosine(46)-N7)-methyltransferase TrmB, partial [bacterium]
MRQRKAKDLDKRLAQCSGYMVSAEDGSLQKFCRVGGDLYVEIGCGKGQFIIKKAAADPDSRFLAIEGQETVILRAAEK